MVTTYIKHKVTARFPGLHSTFVSYIQITTFVYLSQVKHGRVWNKGGKQGMKTAGQEKGEVKKKIVHNYHT